MKRQFLIQQVLSIMEITPYRLEKITYLGRSSISRWVRGAAAMDNGSLYQLYYYLQHNEKISTMLKDEIRRIEKC